MLIGARAPHPVHAVIDATGAGNSKSSATGFWRFGGTDGVCPQIAGCDR